MKCKRSLLRLGKELYLYSSLLNLNLETGSFGMRRGAAVRRELRNGKQEKLGASHAV